MTRKEIWKSARSLQGSFQWRNENSLREMTRTSMHRAIIWKQSNGGETVKSILAKFRKYQNDRVRGEFTSRELRQAEEQINKTAQQECFPDELQAIKENKPLSNKSTLLNITRL